VSVALRGPGTLGSALQEAARRIDASDARLLLAYALGVTRSHLVAHADRVLASAHEAHFARLVERRAAGEPAAYIVGEREFWGLALHVTPAVLIPRPETELLVERALALLPEAAAPEVLELGTGSGAVAVALARERPRARIVATDVSAEALEVARANAERHGARIAFAHGDWLAPVAQGSFDLIVSNPPYVASGDPHLARGDLRFEPRAALDGGRDGLDCIRRIVREAREHLAAAGGWLLLEHGYDQEQACLELLSGAGYRETRDFADLSGRPRACAGRIDRAQCRS
jgi:release factor glutamine methyltransferase